MQTLQPVFALALLSIGMWAGRAGSAEKPTAAGPSVAEARASHWSYRPVKRPQIPEVRDAPWIRNPIDNFVLARLEQNGWQPARLVERRTLLRRVFLDVIGLPPSPGEQQRFLKDSSPGALARVVDELLSRPGYGERWGRHWLDLVRFAESNGYERDAIKPSAWRYRDYVIDALNSDKPYDRFVLEQLAGDELPDRSTETMIATGFYRMGPWDDEPADPKQDRFDQMDDLVRTTSRVFLGLTLGCCRCHDHKFDALTLRDYYRMVAVFNPLRRPQQGRRELDRPAGSRKQLAAVAARDSRIGEIRRKLESLRSGFREKFLNSGRSRLAPEVVAAFRTKSGKRSARQRELVKKHMQQLDSEAAASTPTRLKKKLAGMQQQIGELRRQVPDLPRGYFLEETSATPPRSHVLLRGRAALPGPEVQPGMPAVLVHSQPAMLPPDRFTTRRRLSLARWIVDPAHPLTARVIVNRVWQYHFGAGLVRTASDFGAIGAPPTHPQLLDWLADWFVHQARWSLKKLHRLILTSSTFRMNKRRQPAYEKADPQNRMWWRFPYRRLEVEAIRDSMLSVSGRLNRKMRGQSTYLSVPREALAGHSDPGKIWKPLDEREASRRTVYALIKRSFVVPMLEVLDLCDSTRSAEKRNVTSVPTQALTLLNGEFANRQSRRFAARLQREAGNDHDAQIVRAHRLALCRPPRPSELSIMKQFLEREAAAIRREKPVPSDEAHRQALERLCRVIYNLNEFVYPD